MIKRGAILWSPATAALHKIDAFYNLFVSPVRTVTSGASAPVRYTHMPVSTALCSLLDPSRIPHLAFIKQNECNTLLELILNLWVE